MLRFVARVLIARQHDLRRTGIRAALPFGRPRIEQGDYGRRTVSRPDQEHDRSSKSWHAADTAIGTFRT